MWNNSASCGPRVAAHRLPTSGARSESQNSTRHPGRMCALTGVSRAGFYRRGGRFRSAPVELRDQVQRVALEWPAYGSRRITAELRRCGLPVNRKRVQRVMREDNLLCLRQRKFVATTDSAHGLKVYPNLAAALVVSGVNQLWRA